MERCKAVEACGCSYFEKATGFCTLMWGGDKYGSVAVKLDSDACIANNATMPNGMHYEMQLAKQNSVNEICCHKCNPGDSSDYGY
jgi:hypothetical protein